MDKTRTLRMRIPGRRGAGRDFLRLYGPALAVTIVGLVVAFQFVNPAPPDTLVIGTGGKDGAYYYFGLQYRDELAHNRIRLEVRETAGSLENIRLLHQGKDSPDGVDVALVQGGTAPKVPDPDLVTLGSLFFEPLWVFHRSDLPVESIADLSGKRIAAGKEGSGTRSVATKLLSLNAGSTDPTRILNLGGNEAAAALLAGEVEAAFFVASPKAEMLQKLFRAPGVNLMSFRRADAYTRVYRFLSSVVLPEGVIDFREDIPRKDTVLLAPTANLVARRDLHPALVDRILEAVSEVHGAGGLFEKPGEFPSGDYPDFPMDNEAVRYFKYGPPFLQRFLPFWVAVFIERIKILLLPLIALVFPFFKIMPPTYRWRVRSRIYRWYRLLREADLHLQEGEGPPGAPARTVEERIALLDVLEQEVKKVTIPLAYTDELYDLRMHIEFVRRKLEAARRQPPADA